MEAQLPLCTGSAGVATMPRMRAIAQIINKLSGGTAVVSQLG